MKRKEVEDVMGGKEAWANVDKADGEFFYVFDLGWWIRSERGEWMRMRATKSADTKCEKQRNVREKGVRARRRFSIRCRLGVRMSR